MSSALSGDTPPIADCSNSGKDDNGDELEERGNSSSLERFFATLDSFCTLDAAKFLEEDDDRLALVAILIGFDLDKLAAYAGDVCDDTSVEVAEAYKSAAV